jgi:tRNA (cytidine/uridine-2'-O-)-methyltransferase
LTLEVVLVEPEIPPNTGNIARTCAAVGARLHLVEPLGFQWLDPRVKRAGVDYWHLVEVVRHASWDRVPEALRRPDRLHLFTSRGGRRFDQVAYGPDAVLVFGRESTGLPDWLLDAHPDRWRVIPMRPGLRSLNLSNAAALALYEAMRQAGYPGLSAGPG